MKTVLLILVVAAFLVFSIRLKTELRRKESPLAALKIGQQMPDFDLLDSTGRNVKLSEVLPDKKLVMINFWGTWCAPCRIEMPSFEEIYRAKNKDGFTILAIDEGDKQEKLDAYLKEKPVTFPILVGDHEKLAARLGVEAYPTTILISGAGKILQVQQGVDPYLKYSIERHLKEKKVERK